MSKLPTVFLVALSLGALALLPPSALAKEKEPNYAQKVTAGLRLGEPLVGEIAIIFPLLVDAAPGDAGVLSQNDAGLEYSEPDFPGSRYAVAVTNPSDKKVLVVGGTVLTGGSRDRMLRHDTIIQPRTTVEMRAIPAASSSDIRKEPVPFEAGKQIAPVYLRRTADFGGSTTGATAFITRNLEFRNEGDERQSLAAIGASSVLQAYTAESRKKLDAALSNMKR
ncbi:MAG: hypothetical protein P1V36_05770, partial [Planctomycetota bacterium]|nr:hypothetical protein [Planctomycetota bacterium]